MASALQNSKKLTQRDIARAAGVRQSTVSAALNGTGNISDELREKIQAICAELDYVPNANAASLRSSSSDLIGVVTSPLDSPFHATLVQRIADRLEAQGYRILLSVAGGSESYQRRGVMDLLDQRAQGVIVCTEHPTLTKQVRHILQKQVPLVMIGQGDQEKKVGVDLRQGGAIAGRHLIEIGRKRLVCIADARGNPDDQARVAGFKQAAGKDAKWLEILTIATDIASEWSTVQLTDNLLDRFPDVDGIFAYSDAIALRLVRRLVERDKKVPQDIAVVGFDDVPQARYATVPLTTIAQPIDEYARRAIKNLFNQIETLNSPGKAASDGGGAGVQRVPVVESSTPQVGVHFSGALQPQPPIETGEQIEHQQDAPLSCQLIVRQSTDPTWAPKPPQIFNESL